MPSTTRAAAAALTFRTTHTFPADGTKPASRRFRAPSLDERHSVEWQDLRLSSLFHGPATIAALVLAVGTAGAAGDKAQVALTTTTRAPSGRLARLSSPAVTFGCCNRPGQHHARQYRRHDQQADLVTEHPLVLFEHERAGAIVERPSIGADGCNRRVLYPGEPQHLGSTAVCSAACSRIDPLRDLADT